MKQETFTRSEVSQLLKAQRDKSASSYGKMKANEYLLTLAFKAYTDEIIETGKRLRKVTLVDF